MDDVWVAIDLETTGLSPETDEIIEVGAVKFQGGRVLDTFQSFARPERPISRFIQGLTGIEQGDLDRAPTFDAVAGRLAAFVGNTALVGHNLRFDLGFLAHNGLPIRAPRCDTWELAYVLLPGLGEYSLGALARTMDITHASPHRAVEDATVTKDLFLRLLEELERLDPYALGEMRRLAGQSGWVLDHLLRRVEAGLVLKAASAGAVAPPSGPGPGIGGLDMRELGERLRAGRSLRPNRLTQPLDPDLAASMLDADGPLSSAMDAFEVRREQVEMARQVAKAINDGGRLIVEAGTGVGKSLAYLVPAAMYALANNRRVVVSTNTINLQEQLLDKDIPILVKALDNAEGVDAERFRYTQLKGRANYVCMQRWAHLRSGDTLSESEARLLAKTLVWLRTTCSGDRSELNLGRRDAAAPWDRVSAQGAVDCPRARGPCFLRAARERAAASHLVIVNHALLLTDLASGGSVIPDHDVLIIDEAHHLEEQATRHLGFDVSRSAVDDHLQAVSGDRGVLNEAVTAFRTSTAAATRRTAVEELAAASLVVVPGARDRVARLFGLLEAMMEDSDDRRAGFQQELRVTAAVRSRPEWSDLEIEWENADLAFADLGTRLDSLHTSMEGLENYGLIEYEGLMSELTAVRETNVELRRALAEFVAQPSSDGIYWMRRGGRGGETALHSAPLHVGEKMEEMLFSKRDCVVMTSATLSAGGSFAHVTERTGFQEADELLLGSPFDYGRAALLTVPEDMPEPSYRPYGAAVGSAVCDAALAAGGATMALFTSHAALQATASNIRERLRSNGLSVLAQGVDGTPQRLVARFLDDPRSVLLGTASFWEGVDLAGESLKVLLLARLPFNVPSEPVFSARSEMYENSFSEYAVPQAILRLRQGFGRLIRTRSDRGVAIVLDRRILSRRYGRAFLESLPPVSRRDCRLRDLGGVVRDWLGA